MNSSFRYYNQSMKNFEMSLRDESNAHALLLKTIRKSKKKRKNKRRKKS